MKNLTLARRSACLFAAFTAAIIRAPAQSSYTLTDVGTLPGHTRSFATALNTSGQVAGYTASANQESLRAFAYSAGALRDLGSLPGGTLAMARAINATGQIAGTSLTSGGEAHAVLFAAGSVTDLGTLGGDYSWANGINASGQIVGESNMVKSGRFRAFLHANGRLTDLGALGGETSSASAINDAGQIVGRADVRVGQFIESHAFLHTSGRMTDLGTLGGDGSWANAINASGQIVGASYLSSLGSPVPNYDQHAFLYSGGRMTDLGTLAPYGSSEANAINASGVIVGEVFHLYESNDPDSTGQRAFVYAAGKMSDLNTLLNGARGWTLLQATAINDSGQIAGFGLNPAGEFRAFLLTPSTLPPDPVAAPAPVITRAPASQNIAPGASATLSVTASGSNLSYQWKKNAVAIPGATGASLFLTNAATADVGFYSVAVSNGATTIESAVAIVTLAPPAALTSYTFSVFAGAATQAGVTDGTTFAARFFNPDGIALDAAGNLFVADFSGHTIRKITPAAVVTTIAGLAFTSGEADGPGTAARFSSPSGVAVDRDGNLFVADLGSKRIRKISPAGVVTTPLTGLGVPTGLAVDGSGNLFITDRGACTVIKLTPAGAAATVASSPGQAGTTDGTGSAARFSNYLQGIAIDAAGNLFVADADSHTIRKITPAGVVSTFAGTAGVSGTADGLGGAARFNRPGGVSVDGAGNVFIADTSNHSIRKITPNGAVTTLGGVPGQMGATNGAGIAARFMFPARLTVDPSGNLFITDYGNNTVRKGVPPPAAPPPSRLANLSTRGFVAAGGNLTVGFAIRGGSDKSLLVRAVGPTLGAFGVAGALADPKLELIPANGGTTLTNDDWAGGTTLATAFAGVGAFALPATSKDAAILAALPGASYTARVTSSVAGGSGIAIAEVYDRDTTGAGGQLVNLSTLGFAGSGAQVLTPGFVVAGTEAKNLLIRAIGPGLTAFGVTGTLTDPQLTLIPLGQNFVVASNDNWDGSAATATAFAQAGAFPLAAGSKDAALVVRLPPGGYTVTVSGAAGTTGNTLVEIYDLDP